MLKNKNILVGISGSVAAYKTIDLIRRLIDEGASVSVIMTDAARKFITPLTYQAISNNKVYTDLYSEPMSHILLPANADLFVIAPATANIIGKFASGIADDLLTTCFIASTCKKIIAPAMNWRMYENPVVQSNLKSLLSKGIIQIGPEKGSLACGEEGSGRMSEAVDIFEAVKSALTEKDLQNEKIIVTAGPTREYIDPIRFISNRSSGKMGYALAKVALRRGAEVTLISGYSKLPPPRGAVFISVESAEEMNNAVKSEIASSSVLIMAAAVSDFKPSDFSFEKIDKHQLDSLKIIKTVDIISEARKNNPEVFIIGFSAETGFKPERALKKMNEKNMDMIVFNDVTEAGAGFDKDTNKVILIDRNSQIELPLMDKESVANEILNRMKKIKA
ncbi:MAG: bifunctional phosphopantothenoylcysteine decarboxylase/phosphopantothenate--cysteine ligase CoaBC [Nitrospirae bacterium]|nr:bifunctional phosphopantothenoylcysteine decarboxylase/phosphopantothenate--cysteine ligase CoaBC [Nitrospirota bacterium]